ncbi:DUF1080 domain-containing protein [Gryllotalpicola reticulitermitis]|uniref:DUF1080 domain-containing protein n=1 Tax=Gryllotalpicola reticulitermitis TaxID=1184153 RepID=A0ABV8Q1J3_9MICO
MTTTLFDGATLTGWHATPRLPVPVAPGRPGPDTSSDSYRRAAASHGRWYIEDDAIVGGQEPPGSGLGAYLVTDASYGDFELSFEVKPDWPADTGILVRTTDDGLRGFQILIDHRRSGGIGGFYGNGIGGFHALAHNVDVERDAQGAPVGLIAEDPATTLEPVTAEKTALLSYAASADEFQRAWRWNDFNEFRVRCVGKYPVLTTWVNGVKLYELDTAAIRHPNYDREAVAELLGREGHIALEVHDNDPRMGRDRWGTDAVVRWRNFQLTPVTED